MIHPVLNILEEYKREHPGAYFRIPHVLRTNNVQKAFDATFEVCEAEILAWQDREDYMAGEQHDEWALVIQENGPEEALCDMTAGRVFEKADDRLRR